VTAVAANRARVSLLAAAVLVVALEYLVPYGRYVLYPFTLLSTWVHEMGHGLTALAVGGQFLKLEIFADASGVATTAAREGWRSAAVSAGGLLAPPLLCALVLSLVRGPGRAFLFLVGLAAALVLSLALWVRSLVGLVAVPGLALVLVTGARLGVGRLRLVLAQLVAVVLGVDTVGRTLGYLFVSRVEAGATAGGRSDVGGIADALGGPYWLWGALVAVAALALLLGGLRAALAGEGAAGRATEELAGAAPERGAAAGSMRRPGPPPP
jgi:hypothetical protein